MLSLRLSVTVSLALLLTSVVDTEAQNRDVPDMKKSKKDEGRNNVTTTVTEADNVTASCGKDIVKAGPSRQFWRLRTSDEKMLNGRNKISEETAAGENKVQSDQTPTTENDVADHSPEMVEKANTCNLEAFYRNTSILGAIALGVVIFGTVGNILCIVTLRSNRFSPSTTSFILTNMLLIDMGLLMFGLVHFWLHKAYDINIQLTYVTCSFWPFMISYLRHMSSFMICLLSFERAIAIHFPFHCKNLCSSRRIKAVCFTAMGVYVAVNAHIFAQYNLEPSAGVNGTIVNSYSCQMSEAFSRFEEIVWIPVDSCLGTFIPLILIFVVNSMTAVKIVTSRRAIRSSIGSNDSGAASGRKKVASATTMLFAECLLFLLFNVPLEIWMFVQDHGMTTCEDYVKFSVCLLLSYVSNAVNFIMYMLIGSKFRKAFIDRFSPRCSDTNNAVSVTSNRGVSNRGVRAQTNAII